MHVSKVSCFGSGSFPWAASLYMAYHHLTFPMVFIFTLSIFVNSFMYLPFFIVMMYLEAIESGHLPGDILDDIPAKYVDGALICEVSLFYFCYA